MDMSGFRLNPVSGNYHTGNYVRKVRPTGKGSDFFGLCEVCGKHVSEFFLSEICEVMVKQCGERYLSSGGRHSIYSHEKCVINDLPHFLVGTRCIKPEIPEGVGIKISPPLNHKQSIFFPSESGFHNRT